jgi:hypothetical protein
MKNIRTKINIALMGIAAVICMGASLFDGPKDSSARNKSVRKVAFLSKAAEDKNHGLHLNSGSAVVPAYANPGSFNLVTVNPQKIFMPKSHYTDYMEFNYENPKEARIAGAVYDLRGAFVSSMERGSSNNIGSSAGSLIWRGKDSSGGYVPGGVYLYMIEITGSEEKVISGTVIVAR